MRLATCVAIEIGVGVVLVGALATGGVWAAGGLDVGREPAAERAAAPAPPAIVADAAPPIDAAPDPTARPLRPGEGSFLGEDDRALLAPLRGEAIAEAKFNRGGSSLSLRIEFASGARAAFKPDQTNLQTIPRKEVAAYRIARLLGIDRVAPSIGRRFRVDDIRAHLRPDAVAEWPRFEAEVIRDGEWVDGELAHWIPVIVDAKIGAHRLDEPAGVLEWARHLAIGATVPADRAKLVAQVSDMLLFDYVIDNFDRWSGGNTKGSPDGEVLYFMDNALSFGGERDARQRVRTYFRRAQTFSRRLVEQLRELDEATLRTALAYDVEPFPHLLTDEELAGVLVRRDAALRYVDGLVARHGEARVLVFP